MRIAYRSLLLSCVLFPCIGCDQATKQIAMSAFDDSPHTYLGGILRLQLSYNSGAFLSIGDNFSPFVRQGIFFWGVASLLLAALFYLLFAKQIARPQVIGLGLCLAGGVSNLIDRVRFNGTVVDFLNLGVRDFRTGIFNVADMLILAGAAILATLLFQKTGKPMPTSS